MQNRRIFVDDLRGLFENLDEHDDQNRGVRVKANYFVEIVYNGITSK